MTQPLRNLPNSLAVWCLRNGYTEPSFHCGQWYAFAPNAVMPTPLPYMAKGLKPIAGVYTLRITLLLGVLSYRIDNGAIVSAAWLPNQLYCYGFPVLSFRIGLDLLKVSNLNKVKWRMHLDSSGICPGDWRCERDPQPGLVVSAIALSIQYITDEV